MTEKLLVDVHMAYRHGMTLVGLRDEVFPSGVPVPADHPSREQARMTHLVLEEVVVASGSVVNVEPITACCGVVFAPGTVEIIAWGTALPHQVCVHKSGHPRSFVARMHQNAEDSTLRLSASEEDMDATIVLLEQFFAARGRDWLNHDEGDTWTYDASFNGVFFGDRLHPRGRDVGLERLTVVVPYPGMVRINACGVRDGCSRHLARTETFSLDDMNAVERRVTSHEIVATSISLTELVWCVFTGDCSANTVYEPNDPLHWSNLLGAADRFAS